MSLALTDVSGVGPSTAEILIANKIDSVKKLAGIDIKELASVPRIGKTTGLNMIQSAKDLLAEEKPEEKEVPERKEKPEKMEKPKKKEKKEKKKDGKNKKDKKDKKGKKGKKSKKDKKNKK